MTKALSNEIHEINYEHDGFNGIYRKKVNEQTETDSQK